MTNNKAARKSLEETLKSTRNHLLAIFPYHHGEVERQIEDRLVQVMNWLVTVQSGQLDMSAERVESMFESCEECSQWK